MKVSELEGYLLDYWVAKARGFEEIRVFSPSRPTDCGWVEVRFNSSPGAGFTRYDPSDDWGYGGPIIEREQLTIEPWADGWLASYERDNALVGEGGPTPLIAAMRAYVASKFGDEVHGS